MHHGSQSHVSSLHRVLHITHIYMCIFIYKYTYVRVWALYTQGRYMGLRPLHAGMIYGSGPFIPRDAGRGLSTYMGLGPLYPGMLAGDLAHIRVCAQIHRDLARDYIHTYT